MLTAPHVAALRLFDEKASKLEASTLSRILSTTGLAVSMRLGGHTEGVLDTGELSPEHVDAFVLTARFFVQDNEASSFRNLAEIYSSLPLGDPLRSRFENVRASLNASLDATTIGLPGALSYRRIFDTVMCGGLAHAKEAKHEEYLRWTSNFFMAGFVFNYFAGALGYLLVAAGLVREINEALLLREGAFYDGPAVK
jgi:hypothetical protein